MRIDRFVVFAAAVAALAAACAAPLDDPERFGSGNAAATGCDAPAQVFAVKCTGCHAGSSASAMLDLASPGVASRLVSAPASGGSGLLIDPANPDSSVLLEKLATPPFGARMPLGGPALSDTDLACVRAWVHETAGTPDGGGR